MHLLAAVLLVVAPIAAQPKPKAPAKADQKAAAAEEEEAARQAAAAEQAAAEEAAQRAAAEEAAQQLARARDEARAAEAAALEARGLDARARALTDLLALPLKRLPGDHRAQRFAVLPFEEVGEAVQQQRLGLVVTDLIVTNLARDHRLPLVERAALAKILDEQALGQTGALADGQAAQIGMVAGARALIVGQVSDAGDAFRVSVRAIDAEAGTVLEGTVREVRLPKDELLAVSASSVVLRSRSGAMFRSLVLPGWGQAYNNEPVKAGVFGVGVGGLALATVATAGVSSYFRFIVYEELGTRPGDDELNAKGELGPLIRATRQNSEAGLVAAGVLAGVTAVAWGLGVVDAWVSGVDVESLDAALANN
jgi:TolB-like protein